MSLEKELCLDQPFKDIRHEAVLNIVRTANLLAGVGARLFREFDLTEAQFNVLFSLKYKGQDVTQSDLSKRLVVTRASTTSVLDKLEAKNLVVRKDVPGNRRINHVELTAEGQQLIDRLEPLYRETVHAAIGGLNQTQCRGLIGLLERVRASITDNAGEAP